MDLNGEGSGKKMDRSKHAREYFDAMPDKDVPAWNAMIQEGNLYADQGLLVEANVLSRSAPKKETATWNAIIDGHSKTGIRCTSGFHAKVLHQTYRCYKISILTCCCGLLELMQAHAFAMKLGFERYTALSNILMCAYSRNEILALPTPFLSLEMKDNISWTTFMLVCSGHGQGKRALEALGQMLRSGARPYEITFVGLLSACGHEGLIRKDQKLFNGLSHAYNLVPKAELYAPVTDILGRAGKLKEAKEVITKMPPSKDTAVLGALLSASRFCHDPEITNFVGKQVMELEPDRCGGYVLLANTYAACGKWDEYAHMRKMMKERKTKKIPGYSQKEIKGIEQLFLSGDRSHPEINYVCKCLRDELRCSISVHEDN